MSKTLLINTITPCKNPTMSMVNTKGGMFMVRNSFLEKRGIKPPAKGEIHQCTEPTMVILDDHKKGDYLFGGDGKATIDSSRTKADAGLVDKTDPTANELVYKIGDKPTWDSDGTDVKSFISFSNYKAQMEIELLEKQLAKA